MALIDYKNINLDLILALNKCGFACECDADEQGMNLRYEEI